MTKMIFCKEELIGKTVICRSNEEADLLLVGEFVGFSDPHNIPIVKDDSGKHYYVLGEIVPYNSAIMRMLKSMSPKEQYELLANIRLVNSIIHDERTKKFSQKEETMVKPPKRRSCKLLAIEVIVLMIAAFAALAYVFSQ